ncbi:MAG: RNA polymerase sigma factor [Pseudomonadota bacterium]|nr:RNA polymerase sigma factor [Pseudomonadota bacterium]
MSQDIALLRQTLPTVVPRLRRFARTLTRDAADADDLAQTAIEKALARAAQWRPPPAGATTDEVEAAVRSWMFGIIKNAWIDDRRAAQRHRRVFAATGDAPDAPDHAHLAQEHRLSIESAMQRLPEEQRLAVALVLVEGLSYSEAAQVLDIPVGTLTSRLSRGRETLMQLLDVTGEAP